MTETPEKSATEAKPETAPKPSAETAAAAADAGAEAPAEVTAFEPLRPEIEYDDFVKLDMRVVQVVACERVPKTDKLLQFELDDGSGQPRTVISGIAEHYAPEDLVGKQLICVANLKPRKLRGIASQGMLLTAENDQGLQMLAPIAPSTPGSQIS